MGTSSSSLLQMPALKKTDEQGSIPSTPILTPKVFREVIEKDALDPRSPSSHFARTPIELLSLAANKLETLTIETGPNDKDPVETPLKRHLILGIDPRSPTLELQRTPIVVSASPDKNLPAKIRNKNLDKVRNMLASTPTQVPPKLLDSCPVTPKIKPALEAYKRKSFVLLETNIDFTETDLDAVIKEKYLGKSLQDLSGLEEVPGYELNDVRSPTIDFIRTPIQVSKNVRPLPELDNNEEALVDGSKQTIIDNEVIVQEYNKKQQNTDVDDKFTAAAVHGELSKALAKEANALDKNALETYRFSEEAVSDASEDVQPSNEQLTEDVEVESETPNKSLAVDQNKLQLELNLVDDEKHTGLVSCQDEVSSNIIKDSSHLITKSAPVSPPNIISVTPKKSKSQPVTPPLIDLTADVKELDKKLTNLIYEDEDLIVCPRIVKVKDQSRTPLGVRNCIENKKSTQKLKVSDKPRKAEYAISKIPVFKEKKIKLQCENTPPRGMKTKPKNKRSHWDAKDDTLVI